MLGRATLNSGAQFAKAVASFAVLIFLLATVVASCAFAGFFLYDKIQQRYERRREVEYPKIVASYSDVLRPGADRNRVEAYIRSRQQDFQQMCCVAAPRFAWADLIKIGERTAPDAKWPCTRMNIYVAFEFEPVKPRPSIQSDGTDRLVRVSLFEQPQACL